MVRAKSSSRCNATPDVNSLSKKTVLSAVTEGVAERPRRKRVKDKVNRNRRIPRQLQTVPAECIAFWGRRLPSLQNSKCPQTHPTTEDRQNHATEGKKTTSSLYILEELSSTPAPLPSGSTFFEMKLTVQQVSVKGEEDEGLTLESRKPTPELADAASYPSSPEPLASPYTPIFPTFAEPLPALPLPVSDCLPMNHVPTLPSPPTLTDWVSSRHLPPLDFSPRSTYEHVLEAEDPQSCQLAPLLFIDTNHQASS